jgi:D-lactate dehydratase
VSLYLGLIFRLYRCHGEAIYPGVIDPKTGKSIIAGKEITGFTTQAEYDMHVMDAIRSWGEPLIDEWAEKLGATCELPIRDNNFR